MPKRLKHIRSLRGISKKSLGIAIGIDEFVASTRMNQYERGMRVPSYDVIAALADYWSLPVSYFYERNDDVASLLELMQNLNMKQLKTKVEKAKLVFCD